MRFRRVPKGEVSFLSSLVLLGFDLDSVTPTKAQFLAP